MKVNSEISLTRLSILIAFVALTMPGVAPRIHAAGVTTWSGGGGANQNWSASANWTTVGGSTPPAAGDAVIFRATGAGSSTAINNIVDAGFQGTIASLLFTNETANIFHTTQIPSGTTLTISGGMTVGGTNQTATYTMTGGGTLKGGSGTSVFLLATFNGGIVTNDLSGLNNFIWNAGGNGGNFTITFDTSSFSSAGVLNLASVSNNITATTLTIGNNNSGGSGGTLILGAGTNILNANTIEIGDSKVNGTLQFNSSTGGLRLRNAAGTSRTTMRMAGNPGHSGSASATTKATITLNGHAVDMMIGTLTMADRQARSGGSDNAFFTFDRGIVDCTAINMNNNTSGGTAPTAVMSVGGGTLKVANNISLANNGGTAGTGTLIVTNGGIINAAGIIKTTTIGVGIINVTNSTVAIASSSGSIGTPSIPVDTLNLENATVRLNLDGNNPTPTIVATTVNTNGVNTIRIDSIVNASGTVTLPVMSYTGTDPFGSLTLSLPLGYTGNLIDDTVNSQIELSVTVPVSVPLVWVGATNSVLVSNWDTNKTKDWVDQATMSVAQVYSDPDTVLFDDTASTNVVTLMTTNAPASVTVNNNSLNYTFNGSGKITGITSLNKQGAGSLLLSESGGDDFNGGITVNGGTLIFDNANSAIAGGLTIQFSATAQIGNNDALGTLPSGTLDDEGTLAFQRSDNVSFSTSVSGGGGLTQNGNGKLTLTVANTYTGPTVASRGTLALTAANAISTSSGLVVSNASFDLSAISGVTGLYDFNITNAAITLAVPSSLQAPLAVTSFEADGTLGHSNIINVTALPGIAFYPSTVVLIKSTNGISLAGGNFNFSLGSLPAASPSYAGTLSESPDTTEILLTLTAGPVGTRTSITWAGTNNLSVTTNWSDNANWQLPGAPTATDKIIFNDFTTVADGSTNNVVDSGFGGTVSSLTYSQLGDAQSQNTLIPGGTTLNVTGTGGLTVGSSTQLASTASPVTTISGAGSLVVNNPSANVNVTLGEPSTSGGTVTLNMTNLNTFNFTGARLMVGVAGPARSTGNLYLARTNAISLSGGSPQIDIGDNSGNNGPGSALFLGQTNVIFADSIAMGRAKQNSGGGGVLLFNPAITNANPVAYFRGADGVSPVSTWAIGDGGTGGGTTTFTGITDLSGGTVNAVVNAMWVGKTSTSGSASTGSVNGTLTFSGGTITVNNLTNGMQSTSLGFNITAAINVNGTGILTVNNNLMMGNNDSSSGTTTASLNITGGTVQANSIISGGGNTTISLTDGTLGITSTAGSLANPISTLNLTDSGAMDTKLQLGVVAPGATNIAASAINVSGVTTLSITAFAGLTGTTQIPLISYNNGVSPIAGLTLGSLPPNYVIGNGGALVDNTANQTIDIIVTPPAPILWVGAVGSLLNSSWDTTTTDWKNGGSPTAYSDADYVQFDDSASNGVVTLATTVSPIGLTVNNNTLNYTFNGSGKISGYTGLVKEGSGALVLDNSGSNDFSGGVNIAGGSLQIGNNDASGNLPATGNILDNGTLILNRADSTTIGNAISGGGAVTQNGNGTNRLAALNSYTGTTLISSGTLTATVASGGNSSIGSTAGAVVITNGGVLDIENSTANSLSFTNTTDDGGKQFYIAGAGIGNGAIVNNGTANQQNAIQKLTLTADATVGGPARWDMRVPSGHFQPIMDLGGHTLTKTGSNQMSMVALVVTNGGSIIINQGTLSFETISSNSTTPITVNAGGVLGHFRQNATLFTAPITLNGGMIRDLNGTPGSTNDSPITLTANSFLDLNVNSTDLVRLNGVISESGGSFGLTKTNVGSYALSAVNTYSGTTFVAQGKLILADSGSIANSKLVNIASGATFDASQRTDGTLTLTANQTLSGFGTVTGAVVAASGSTVAPGSSSTIGTLTFASNVTLAGTNAMKLNHDLATSDQLSSSGIITLGGTLSLTNISGSLAAGDTFKLFNAPPGNYSGAFTSIVPATPGAGLTWDTNNLVVNGTLSISGGPAGPSITGASLSGTTLTLSGNGGTANTSYRVMSSTSLATPRGSWSQVGTGSFDSSGNFTVGITINPAEAQRFYILISP
jgi:fibronectin-binding autotransporter adhesin